jgi:hypothetical protein
MSENTTTTLFSYLPSELADHPLLSHIPVLQKNAPEFFALVDSVRERGFDYPALVTSERRIVDGRNRRNAAAFLGIPLPCRIVDAGEVAGVAFSSLAHRRNLTKSALAYLVFPLVAPAFAEAKQRHLAYLRTGPQGGSIYKKMVNAQQQTINDLQTANSGESPAAKKWQTGKTIESLTDEIGINREYMRMAKAIHAAFAKHPKLREQFEADLVAGNTTLTAVQHAVDGKTAANEGKTVPGKNDAPTLILRAFADLGNRWTRWEKIPEGRRQDVTAKVVAASINWPHEVAVATAAAWKNAGII